MPLVSPMIGVSLRAARSRPRYRSAVVTSRLLLRTAVASESIFQTRPRRCAPKSAPTDDVSELPLVPTNEAPRLSVPEGRRGRGRRRLSGGGESGGETQREHQNRSNRRHETGALQRAYRSLGRKPSASAHSSISRASARRRRVYSHRSASAGSVEAARSAGSVHATSATGISTIGAARNDTGSSGVMPNSTPSQQTRQQRRARQAGGQPDAGDRQPLPDHERHEARPGGAERRAHAELATPLPHAVRQHAVQAHRRQDQRQQRERRQHRGREPRLIDRRGDAIRQHHGFDRGGWRQLAHERADGGRGGRRR